MTTSSLSAAGMKGAGKPRFGFEAIRLPFEPEMRLIPLFGHSRADCGVAIRTGQGWHFYVGEAAL